MLKQTIKITHFINPHSWWFKLCDESATDANRRELTEALLVTEVLDFDYDAEIAVYYKDWNQYLRCKIVAKVDDGQFIAWAIDEGFPIRTSECFMCNFGPLNFKKNIVQHAGIMNILPNSHRQVWTDEVCKDLENLINRAKKVVFCRYYINAIGQNWGELILRMHRGGDINVAQYLLNRSRAIESKENFRQLTISLPTTKGPAWVCNDKITQKVKLNLEAKSTEAYNLPRPPDVEAFRIGSIVDTAIVTNPGENVNLTPVGRGRGAFLSQISQKSLMNGAGRGILPQNPNTQTAELSAVEANANRDVYRTTENVNGNRSQPTQQINEQSLNFSNLEPLHEQPYCMHRNLSILPAGYDLNRLNKYNDPNHWHIKPSNNNQSNVGLADATAHSPASQLEDLYVSNERFSTLPTRKTTAENKQQPKEGIKLQYAKQLPQTEDNTEIDDILKALGFDGCVAAFQTSFTEHLVLAHSRQPLESCASLQEVFFDEAVIEAMRRMHFNRIYRLQSYAWQQLAGNNSWIAINAARSGKTWCYLPLLATHVKLNLQSRKAGSCGPSAIVIVATKTSGEYVVVALRELLKNSNRNFELVVPYLQPLDEVDVRVRLINGCGVLVATPQLFVELVEKRHLETKIFNTSIVKQIVIDQLDVVLEQSFLGCKCVFQSLFKVCAHSQTNGFAVQFCITACKYIPDLMPRIMRTMDNPSLIIGDFLEAAVYACVRMHIKISPQNQKLMHLSEWLSGGENSSRKERSIIVCETDEDVEYLHNAIKDAGLGQTLAFTQHASLRARLPLEIWRTTFPPSTILICSDAVLPELIITNVHNLMHYSLPKSWTQFTMRFAVMRDVIPNYVQSNFDYSDGVGQLRSLILLDQQSLVKFPRLIDFLEQHRETVPIAVREMVSEMERQEQVRLAQTDATMCPLTLEFGHCGKRFCGNRHILNAADLAAEGLPLCGDIHIAVTKVHSPTHLVARLVAHKPPGGQWLPKLATATQICLGLQLYYSAPANCTQHWPINVGDVCVIQREAYYDRVQVVSVPASKQQKFDVSVRLFDLNNDIIQVKSAQLLACPDAYRTQSTNVIELRLTGVTPNNSERLWCSEAQKEVQKWLTTNLSQRIRVQATIDFVMCQTVYVRNVLAMEQLPTLGDYICRINLKGSLLLRKFAKTCDDNRGCLLAMIVTCERNQAAAAVAKSEVDEQNQSVESDRASVNDTLPQQIAISNCVSNHLCADGSWCELPLKQLIKVQLGDEKQNGFWSFLYLQRMDDADVEQFIKCQKLISEHIEALKANQQQQQSSFNVENIRNEHNCIVKYNGSYMRARLLRIVPGTRTNLYRFFLVDHAVFIDATTAQLGRDFYYETNAAIVNSAPFQAVHVTLAGINIKRFAMPYELSGGYLYAYALQARAAGKPDIGCNSYKILLLECETEADFSAGILLNKQLIAAGVARENPDTKHLLELPIVENPVDEHENPAGYGDLLSCLHDCLQLESEEDDDDSDEPCIFAAHTIKDGNFDALLKQFQIPQTNEVAKPMPTANTTAGVPPASTVATPAESSASNQLRVGTLASISSYKKPVVSWFDTSGYVHISVAAAHENDYEISWQGNEIIYLCESAKESFFLNLFDIIGPNSLMHERRGLCVIIKILKRSCYQWPTLMRSTAEITRQHFPWLKYDFTRGCAYGNGEKLSNMQLAILRNWQNYFGNKPVSVDSDEDEMNQVLDSDDLSNCDDPKDF